MLVRLIEARQGGSPDSGAFSCVCFSQDVSANKSGVAKRFTTSHDSEIPWVFTLRALI